MKHRWIVLSAASFALSSPASELSLNNYLDQVRASHPGYKSSVTKSSAAEKRREEAALPFSFALFAEASYLRDASPRINAFMQGNRNDTQTYSLGFSKQTRFGLNSKFYYTIGHNEMFGLASFGGVSLGLPQYYTNSLNLELNQSLLKNGFGRASRATEQATIAQQDSTRLNEKFQALSALTDAEAKYWNLALAQEIVKIRQDGLARAEEIVNYNLRKRKQNLVEATDLFQAQAAFESRRLEYQGSLNGLAEAAIAFNLARGRSETTVGESLSVPDLDFVLNLEMPKRDEMRLDTLAAKRATDAATANSIAGTENSRPDLQIYGKLSTGGLNPDFSNSTENSLSTRYPTAQVGIKLNVPLDRGAVDDTQDGYRLESQSAELAYQRKLLEQEMLWKNLTRGFQERKQRLQTASETERLHREKLENEKKARSAGRSTTFTVLQFEQDYLGAQAAKLQLMLDALTLYAQMKTFGGV